MSQVTYCDLCREIIKISDKKFLFVMYPVTDEDDETKKLRFKEVLEALYEGKSYDEKCVRVVEICTPCAGVFAHLMTLRKKELIKSRREVRRLLSRKTRKENNKEKKNG
jgi:hypothetical protein